ncbi:hypothetical protein NPIL_267431 [Nephila pilipes]|uniref:Uncharacterized protein n=1 Tax=Nephila pilipes TaxID=299642 RepID=A0A8X6MPY4_NEPPI|nr:hypothetical protein NPIL_267431 [Nephila pilipes]
MSIKGNVRTGRARGCGSTGMVMKISGGDRLFSVDNLSVFKSETLSLVGKASILGRIKTSFRFWAECREVGSAAAVSGLPRIRVSEKSGSRYAYCSRFSWDDGFLELVTADHRLGRSKMMLDVS